MRKTPHPDRNPLNVNCSSGERTLHTATGPLSRRANPTSAVTKGNAVRSASCAALPLDTPGKHSPHLPTNFSMKPNRPIREALALEIQPLHEPDQRNIQTITLPNGTNIPA